MTNNLDRLAAFLRSLAQALHISGMPAHDLERHLNAMGQRLGVRVDCFAVLTMLTLNITTDDTNTAGLKCCVCVSTTTTWPA